MQTHLIQKLTSSIEEKTGSTVTVGSIDFSFFNKLVVEDIYISDNHQDTLFYVKKLTTNISGVNLVSSNFRLSNLELESPYLKIISYNEDDMSLFTFLDALDGETTQDSISTPSSYFFSSAKTTIKNGRFVYYEPTKEDVAYGMNYEDLDFFDINAKISKLRTVGDAIKMTFDSLECKEKSGLIVEKSTTDLIIDTGLLRLENVAFNTPKSNLNAEYLNFSYTSNTGAWGNFTTDVQINYKVDESRINLNEVSLFNDNLRDYNETLIASGHITGTVKNVNCQDIKIKTYNNTEFEGNISMNGLPYIDETFFDAKINHFQTSLDDLEKVHIPNYETGHLSFPQELKKLGIVKAKGKYTGFVSDFVFYGQLFSSYGNISTDISVKPTTRTKQLELSGKIITTDFRAGDLLENKILGNISLNVDVVNAMANDDYNSYAEIKGIVTKIDIKDYAYEKIKIDGYFAEKVFDGKVSMNDENIAFDFQGKFDLHEEIPKTNFTLDVKRAKLAPLHLNMFSADSLAYTQFKIQSQLDGGRIDNATGKVSIYDLEYTNSKGSVSTDSITLTSSLAEDMHNLFLSSDFVDINFIGDFKIPQLSSLPKRLAAEYMNIAYFKPTDSLSNERGDLIVDMKNLNPIIELFTEGYKISDNALFTASYILQKPNSEVDLKFDAGYVKIGDRVLHNINFTSKGKAKLETQLAIDRIEVNDRYNLLLFNLDNTLENNKMETLLSWGDKKKLPYSGKLSLHSIFKELGNNQLSIENLFMPTTFVLDGVTWGINKANFTVDSTDVNINNFNISNGDESVKISGVWSANKGNSLTIDLDNFEIGHIWNVLGIEDVKLSAKISGNTRYKERSNTSFELASDLQIPQLFIENQNLGTLNINSDWNQEKQALETKASLRSKDKELFSINGYYGFKTNSLNYALDFNQFDLEVIKGFTKDLLNNLQGSIDGKFAVKGNVDRPIIDGKLNLNIPNLTLAETGVSYHLKESLDITQSLIKFNNFKLLDETNKSANVNGEVFLGFNKNSKINLKVTTDKLKVLHNSYQTLAYGNARVTSLLNITGDFSRISIKGNVATDNNSKIIVPYGSTSEVSDNDFITFINPADSTKYRTNDILFIPTGAKSPVSFDLNFSIEPSSEIQVLLESNNGSALKSQGSADLYVSRDRSGNQYILGQYTVSQGSFLYSLEGIVSKKFILQEGGTIQWNGAPEKAYLNLNAVYQLKTSVQPLLQQDENPTKQRQTVVLCKTHITGQLEDPKLTFEIDFPNLDNTTKGNVMAALQSADITKQILSLFVFNRFITPEYSPEIVGTNNGNALISTTSDLLSSQVSNILSQLSDDINIGFIYRPGDDMTQEELGLAVSTELLHNRVVISGNFGFSSQDESNRFNDFIGDIDFDIKLNKKGNLRLRAFSHAKDNLYYYENKRNIQGVGIVYSEEFDTFKELVQRYKEKLGWSKKKDEK